jgi:hypothetical protein
MNREKFENAPPEKKFKYSVNPNELELLCDRKYCCRTWTLIPGIGITAPNLLINSRKKVIRLFLRNSWILNISTREFAI